MYVELKNINKSFGNFKASDNVSFGVEKGKLVALLGPSGSGKTTILRMIAGLETPDSGEVIIDGKVMNDIPAAKRGIGFVFQNYALFRYMTVEENIAFGLKVQKLDKNWLAYREWVNATPASFLADKDKGLHLPGQSLQIPTFFCWTSLLPP